MVVKEKPQFVYTGQKDSYKVRWFDLKWTDYKPEERYGAIFFIIKVNNERIHCYYNNPLEVIETAKKKIYARGRGADAYGKATVWFKDLNSGKEVLCATVEKNVHRYYEPVERFYHGKGGY